MLSRNLIQRGVSGAIFVATIVSSILVSSWTFLAVFLIISSLAIREFYNMINSPGRIDVMVGPAIVANCILFFVFFARHFMEFIPFNLMPIYGLFVILVLLSELFRHRHRPLHNWAYFFLGQAMVSLPFALLSNVLYFNNSWNPNLLLAVFVIIWVNDTFAYLVGSTLGKHRLFERISPKKSWEGFIGGAVASVVAGYVFSLFETDLVWWQWLIFSLLVVVFGTFGDLMESLIKRSVGVKDSGRIIPGHGGLLDRFDSMLLAVPVIFLYLQLF